MYAAIGESEVFRQKAWFQRLKIGRNVWTPNGIGKVAGKYASAKGLMVLVDHGTRMPGVTVVVAYGIQVVMWRTIAMKGSSRTVYSPFVSTCPKWHGVTIVVLTNTFTPKEE